MPFGQREEVVVDELGGPPEPIYAMTFLTSRWKSDAGVAGIGGGVVILQMAVQAFIPDPVEFQYRLGNMALITIQGGMGPNQWKAILIVQAGNIIHQPVLRSVATRTVRTDSSTMHIRMAGNTLRGSLGKDKGLVAIPAINYGMLAGKGESSLSVVEKKGIL